MIEQKELIVDAVAKVQIGITPRWYPNREFVCFTIPSPAGISMKRSLLVYDYRDETVRTAREITAASWENHLKTTEALNKIVNQLPARVVVVKKTEENRKFHYYVNLYPPNGQEPTDLFSETEFIAIGNASFRMKDRARWSWMTESFRYRHPYGQLVTVVALTNQTHKIIVGGYGCAMIRPTNNNLTIIADDIQQVPEKKLA